MAIPIAVDRDNEFFNQDGVLPTMVANDISFLEIQDFDYNVTNLDGLISSFDEYFLRTATIQQFRNEAFNLQKLLSNIEVKQAFNVWLKEVDSLNGAEI